MIRVLVLGTTGMLGSAVFRTFDDDGTYEVWGTLRSHADLRYFSESQCTRMLTGCDVLDQDGLVSVISRVRPQVVINCIGLIKQLSDSNDPLTALPINAMFPHRLARLCGLSGARLIHVSTDCVFSGRKGKYTESDISDAEDLYGKSKYIGELHDVSHAITLRTSIIGHELHSNHALVDWFLSQQGPVQGYSRTIFSGLPTVELARVMKDFVLPHSELSGLYHVGAQAISKHELLHLIAAQYGKNVDIELDDAHILDRSLDCTRFRAATNYVAPEWPELIRRMHAAVR